MQNMQGRVQFNREFLHWVHCCSRLRIMFVNQYMLVMQDRIHFNKQHLYIMQCCRVREMLVGKLMRNMFLQLPALINKQQLGLHVEASIKQLAGRCKWEWQQKYHNNYHNYRNWGIAHTGVSRLPVQKVHA